MSAMLMTHSDNRQADFQVRRIQALHVGQAGVEDTVRELSRMRIAGRLDQPFMWYDALMDKTLYDGSWVAKDDVSIGQYDITVTGVSPLDRWTRDVNVTVVGYVPSKCDPGAGRDGLMGTADDDVVEDDNTFQTERYNQLHADAGLIPEGKHVGDPIADTGEDLDGARTIRLPLDGDHALVRKKSTRMRPACSFAAGGSRHVGAQPPA